MLESITVSCMIYSMRYVVSVCLFVLLCALLVSAKAGETGETLYTNIDGKRISEVELDKSINKWMKEAAVPGLSIAVVKSSSIVYFNTYGKTAVKNGSPVKRETLFEAASLSKPVFAYLVLQIADKGLIDLDKPLYTYLGYADIESDPRYKLITARMALSHRTGFPNWRRKKPLSIIFEPGSKFSYSGEGYMYLQKVVEKLTGKPLETIVKEKVFIPLGMSNSRFVWDDSMAKNLASGYSRSGEPKRKWKPATAWAAGSLHTTAEDYAKFLIAIMDRKHLSSSMARKMFWKESRIPDHGGQLGWTLGFGYQKTNAGRSFWHWGSNDGYKSYTVGYAARKFALVYLTNSDNGLDMSDDLTCFAIGGKQPALDWLHAQHKYKIKGDCSGS